MKREKMSGYCLKCEKGYLDRIAKLVEALSLLQENHENFMYETEYDDSILYICLFCHHQGGKHSEDCIKESLEQALKGES